MYSFNLDYIFNIFYNFLLALRYIWLFWILRITPKTYLADHKYDKWDGLRDRGWIKTSKPNVDEYGNIISNSPDSNLSGWDLLKEKIFNINNNSNNNENIMGGDLSDDLGLATEKTNNYFWNNLDFSIQNPILDFAVNLLIMISFFIFIVLIYSIFAWLFLILKSKFTTNDKSKEKEQEQGKELEKNMEISKLDKLDKRREGNINETEAKKIVEKKVKHVYTFDPKLKLTEAEKLQKIKEIEEELRELNQQAEQKNHNSPSQNNSLQQTEENKSKEEKSENKNENANAHKKENSKEILKEAAGQAINQIFPAGIPGLPIDISEFNQTEKEENNLEIKKESKKELEKNIEAKIEVKAEERNELADNLKDWRNRWAIIQKYMEGKEETFWRIAILEADNLLNEILIDRGYMGETVSEKLKNAKFSTIHLAWDVHKIRNRIAHEGSKFVLAETVAKKTIATFEAILMEFKVLE